jgi:SNF2 family DNA or RNA helicase
MKPFKHFGALKNGNGFGIVIDDLPEEETEEINRLMRRLKTNIRGVKLHPNYYPRGGKMLNAWVIPAEHAAIEPMLEVVDGQGFKRNASAERLIGKIMDVERERVEQHNANQALSSAQSGPEIVVPGLVGELRDYQRAAVDWVLRNKRVYIGDEMGTGKTLSSLAAIAVADAYPVVVVCPASVKMGWQRQIDRFFPGLSDHVFICNGRKSSPIPSDAKVIIVNYDILFYWQMDIVRASPKSVIFDEAHFIKNKKSKRTRAANNVALRRDIKIAMSGTPVTNRPIELMSQLSVIDRLDDISGGKNWWFIERYCDPTHNGYGFDVRGASNLFELNERLRRHGILIRRRKEDVLTELPPKERISIPLEINNRTEYEKIRNDIKHWVISEVMSDPEVQRNSESLSDEAAQKYMIAEIRSRLLKANSALAIVKLNALRRVCMRGKIKSAIEWIDDFLTSGEKIVVFCSHREAVDLLYAHLGERAVKVVGGMGMQQRQDSIDRFVDDDNIRVVIANIDAAAEGIDGWQHVCSNVAFLELTWTPTKHHQAEDRCHRSGQTNPVSCYYLMAADTIDERLASLIDHKRAVVSAIVDGQEVEEDENILADLLNRLTSGEF